MSGGDRPASERTIRVVVADDHTIVREGLVMILRSAPDIEVVGEASDGEQAVAMVQQSQPDVVVMDISMPGTSGLEAIRRIRRDWPQVKVLALTIHESEDYILHVLRAGVHGYVVKRAAGQELLSAIRAVMRGESYLHPAIVQVVLSDYLHRLEHGQEEPLLTEREREIVRLIAEGYKNREIAQRLNISLKTVETHRANIMQKLNINDRVQLVRFAIRTRLIEP
ncbi:MAG: response regulator transcription factor [Firmicutes bacterium]|uniref:Response regulator transcription factor n=1 Tax=Geochorda subterranea TaxID=3109564 RepID=A0ABZ1BRP5_9FIRM|nr:response regulator transcription factor [Limnochorda sp. LNt]NLG69234.1 response regulator transcription factor [Bacillota bacterium]WRP15185.1 response regulator transcription factor [Limnochorda sp. LNt]